MCTQKKTKTSVCNRFTFLPFGNTNLTRGEAYEKKISTVLGYKPQMNHHGSALLIMGFDRAREGGTLLTKGGIGEKQDEIR